MGAHLTGGPLVTVDPETDVREVMERMKEHRVRRLPVVSGGRLVGVVSLADVVRLEGPVDPLEVESVLEGVSASPHSLVRA